MDFELKEAQKTIHSKTKGFAVEHIRPRLAEMQSCDRFPAQIREGMREFKFWGLPYPKPYGGTDEGYLSYALALEAISEESAAVGATLSVHTMAAATIFHYGTEEQKRAFLPPLLTGEQVGSFSFTEAATGTDPVAIKTVATREVGRFILNGSKMFSSNSTLDGIAIVFARDEEREGSISAFIVPKHATGFETGSLISKSGLNGFETAPFTLNGVSIPEENVVGGEAGRGKGFAMLLDIISIGKMGIAAQSLGMAERALEESLEYAAHRKQLNKPLRMFPTIQALVAEMVTEIEASRWLVYHAAALRQQGKSIGLEGAMAKLFCARSAERVIDKAMSIHGCYAYTRDFTVERLYRDVKLGQLYEGTEEIQKIIIASKILWPDR